MMDGGYDEIYQSAPCVWGSSPGSLIRWLTGNVPGFVPSSILDAGCGEGKNSLFYGMMGIGVRAIDISELAIGHARTLWGECPTITWEVADIRSLCLAKEAFDLVIAYGLLHCLGSREEVVTVVAKLQAATRYGGFHVVCTFNDRYQELEAHNGFRPLLLNHAYFETLYGGWQSFLASDENLTSSDKTRIFHITS